MEIIFGFIVMSVGFVEYKGHGLTNDFQGFISLELMGKNALEAMRAR